jgi:hypothetical protein
MTATNLITLASKFMPILDEIYKASSVTARLDSLVRPVSFAGADVVEVFKLSVPGLGTYSRKTGYPKGSVTGTWETLTLGQSRGREFSIDRMDDEETLGMAFGQLAGEFIRVSVAPELDAYRFAKYLLTAGNEVTAADLSSSTVLSAIDTAKAYLDEDSVPVDGRILFVSDSVKGYLEAAVTRFLGNENSVDRRVATLDGMPVIMVPQSRFYNVVTLNAGTEGSGSSESSGGFAMTGGGKAINFMIIHPSAILQVTKLAQLKIFAPDENQTMDAWKIQYRVYHDAFVLANKVNGIAYQHKA